MVHRVIWLTLITLAGFIIRPISSVAPTESKCDLECEDAIRFFSLNWHSTRAMALSKMCFDPKDIEPPVLAPNIDVRMFKPKSTWLGAFLSDVHGLALSPLFLGHSNLSCTEYALVQVTPMPTHSIDAADQGARITLEMKHYASDKVDYRFGFNQSGWVVYDRRYGCANNSMQVNNTRIIDTDYETYVVISSCADSSYMSGFHQVGYLLLVDPATVTEAIWEKFQELFDWFAEYDSLVYPIPNRTSVLSARESECIGVAKRDTKKVTLCRKSSLKTYAEGRVYLIKDVLQMQKSRRRKELQAQRKQQLQGGLAHYYEEHEVPYEEIACLGTMFVSVALSLYWTHFSF